MFGGALCVMVGLLHAGLVLWIERVLQILRSMVGDAFVFVVCVFLYV